VFILALIVPLDASVTAALNSAPSLKSPSGTPKNEQKLNEIGLRLTLFRGENPGRARPVHHGQKLLHRRRHSCKDNKKGALPY